MRHLLPLPVLFLLAACGMKGICTRRKRQPTVSRRPAVEPVTDDADKGERKTIRRRRIRPSQMTGADPGTGPADSSSSTATLICTARSTRCLR